MGANPDTAFVDIRNQHNYVSRSYSEEIDFEIRSMLTNPNYYNALFSTDGGSLSYAMAFQNMYGSLILSGGTINSELGNQMANVVFNQAAGANSIGQGASVQSNAAFLFYMQSQGLWDASPEMAQQLADTIISTAITYGVACCHHTCKNLDFNMEIIQASSLSPEQKNLYAQILSAATLTDPLYVAEDAPVEGDGQSESSPSSEEILVNGTTENNEGGASATSGGVTPVGDQPSTSQSDANSASSAQSTDSASSSASDDSSQTTGSKAYELSRSSPARAISGESSMPIIVIAIVIVLIAIFMSGYVRNKEEDEY